MTSPTYAITAAHSLSTVPVSLSSSLPSATGVTYKFTREDLRLRGPGRRHRQQHHHRPAGRHRPDELRQQLRHGRHHPGRVLLAPVRNDRNVRALQRWTVAANTTVVITFAGIKNPATAATYTASVSTTSDPAVKKSAGYCVVAAGVPCIASVAPTSGGVGTAVTITGLNLAGATALKFHGTTAAILTNTATKITTKVPAGATTGTLTVTTGGGTATSPAAFTVVAAPAITSFTPDVGTGGHDGDDHGHEPHRRDGPQVPRHRGNDPHEHRHADHREGACGCDDRDDRRHNRRRNRDQRHQLHRHLSV